MEKKPVTDHKNKFTVEDHNEILQTLDNMIQKIKAYNKPDNLELNNAIKDLLSAGNRINKYYSDINNPITTNSK